MRRIALSLVLMFSFTLLALSQGQDGKGNLSGTQEEIARNYKALEGTLIKIASKLERTGTKEGIEKARIILRALQEAREKDIAPNLTQLADVLKDPDVTKLRNAVEKGGNIKQDLEVLLAALLSERSSKEHTEYLKNLVKELEKAIRDQKVAISKNQSNAVEKEDARKAQEVAEKQVQKILAQIKDYEAKSAPKDGKPKEGEPKEGDKNKKPNDKNGKENESKENKDNKANPKDGEPKDGKPKDGKPKDGEPKDGKPKDGKPKDSEPKDGKPKDGEPKDGQPKDGEPKDGESKDGQKKPPGDKKDEEQDAGVPRKRIQDANDAQSKAKDKIEKNERKEALNDQEDAKTKLEQARKKLEQILRQMREEEIERVLADLQKRCEKMKQMQEIVNAGTKQIHTRIYSLGKPEREDEQNSRRLSEDEDKIVHEADNAIAVIEAEGTAVAFIEVFHQVRNDMIQVSRRLGRVDVGLETQMVEDDIITTLKEMIDAFKKQQQEQRDKKQNEQQQQQQQQQNQQDLIDKLAELRMIRAMQLRVNNRTVQWSKRYEGEVAREPTIMLELNDLGRRQLRIQNVTDNIAKGRNK